MSNQEKLLIKVGKKLYIIDKHNINWIESDQNYIRIIIENRAFVLKSSLKAIEEKLNSEAFIRINQSTIVNVDIVKELIETNNRDYIVILNNGKKLRWGRGYKKNFSKFLKL